MYLPYDRHHVLNNNSFNHYSNPEGTFSVYRWENWRSKGLSNCPGLCRKSPWWNPKPVLFLLLIALMAHCLELQCLVQRPNITHSLLNLNMNIYWFLYLIAEADTANGFCRNCGVRHSSRSISYCTSMWTKDRAWIPRWEMINIIAEVDAINGFCRNCTVRSFIIWTLELPRATRKINSYVSEVLS